MFKFMAYTDGACSGNPGIGGWGAVLLAEKNNEIIKRKELSGSAKEKPSQGEVVAVGPGKLSDTGEAIAMNVSVGDTVIFGQYGGNEIKLNGEEYLILSERDIFGVVE